MTVEHFLSLLKGLRRVGDNKCIACCPAHDDRCPSLSICVADDRILLKCWAGCKVDDICGAIGIDLADLFTTSACRQEKPSPAAVKRCRAAERLEAWRWKQIRRLFENLRTRDMVILQIDRAVVDGLTEEEAMGILGHEYDGYSELEHRFDCLVRCEGVLELWRESRTAARP